MIHRHVNLSKLQSFFLFGARGVGKSTLLEAMLPRREHLWIDLLAPSQRFQYLRHPERLLEVWRGASEAQRRQGWIVIDEIQRVPQLLDVVHMGIEQHALKFALTGSSARKLRHGAANLLAGRALTFSLLPFSSFELGEQFVMEDALNYGLLPQAVALRTHHSERQLFLKSYVDTYLREEIQAEGLVRKFEPFYHFLEVAADASGTIVNFSRISKRVNLEPRTVLRYFELLVDTLIGFFLPIYRGKVRNKQAKNPKFYFFDTGIMRAATHALDTKPVAGNYIYGKLFEHFVILEIIKANANYGKDYVFSYYKEAGTNNAEIDLIASKGKRNLAIEIKSNPDPDIVRIRQFARLSKKIAACTPYILCRTDQARVSEGVSILPWQAGVRQLFG